MPRRLLTLKPTPSSCSDGTRANLALHTVFQLLPLGSGPSQRSRGGRAADFGLAGGTILSSSCPTRPMAST